MSQTKPLTFLVEISSLVIDEGRFRKGLGSESKKAAQAFDELVDSMRRNGQLENILVQEIEDVDGPGKFRLIAGYRRVRAATSLGWTHVEAKRIEDLDEYGRRELELEENIIRHDFTWPERIRAIAELHRLKSLHDPNWTQSQTGLLVGLGQNRVHEALLLDTAMQAYPELAAARKISHALSRTKQIAKHLERRIEVREREEEFLDIESRIILGDSIEVIKSLPFESIDHIITDPPFGVEYDRRKEGSDGEFTSYEDSVESYEHILTMVPDLYRVLKPDGFCIWFFGISWYERVKTAFRGAGFTVDELPIIWDRTEGTCHTNRPDRYFSRGYDVALHAFKGEPEIVKRGHPNIFRHAPISSHHRELLVERPVPLYQDLIQHLTLPGQLVADFFVGSGSCPAAAASVGRNYLGVELNPERRLAAIKKIHSHTPIKDAA